MPFILKESSNLRGSPILLNDSKVGMQQADHCRVEGKRKGSHSPAENEIEAWVVSPSTTSAELPLSAPENTNCDSPANSIF